jgi:hypothetical protein
VRPCHSPTDSGVGATTSEELVTTTKQEHDRPGHTKTVNIFVNDVKHTVSDTPITGREIATLGGVPDGNQIFLEVPGPGTTSRSVPGRRSTRSPGCGSTTSPPATSADACRGTGPPETHGGTARSRAPRSERRLPDRRGARPRSAGRLVAPMHDGPLGSVARISGRTAGECLHASLTPHACGDFGHSGTPPISMFEKAPSRGGADSGGSR